MGHKNSSQVKQKKPQGLRFTDRDRELIYWTNSMGFINCQLLAKKWGVTNTAASRRLAKLHSAGLFTKQRLFWSGGNLHVPTQEALDLIGDDMPPLPQIALGTYSHNYAVVEIAIELESDGGKFVSERRFRRALIHKTEMLGNKKHIPDGLYYPSENSKPYAVEVELTIKHKPRLEKIANDYRYSAEYAGVKYFSNNDKVRGRLKEVYSGDFDVTIEERDFGGIQSNTRWG